jgi:hypothetical protein
MTWLLAQDQSRDGTFLLDQRGDSERGGGGGERVSPPTLATGSLVYQSEEYDELMRLLGSSEA